MKKSTVALLSLSVLLINFAACKKKSSTVKSERKFDFVLDKIPVEVPAMAITGQKDNFVSFKHRLNLDSLVKTINTNYTKANLTSLTLRSCTISTTNETVSNSLGNFSILNLEAIALDKKITSLAIAKDIKDTVVYTITLNKNSTTELASFFNKDTISYQFSGNLRKAINKTLSTDAQLIYDVSVSE